MICGVLVETAVVFLFLTSFALDDLNTRSVSNGKIAVFFAVAVILLILRGDVSLKHWAIETALCAVIMILSYGLGIFGGADLKIVTVLSAMYGPAAVFYAFLSILIGFVWQRAFVRDGVDRLIGKAWNGIPVLFFYLFVFAVVYVIPFSHSTG